MYTGTWAGRVRASSRPVTIAEQSFTVFFRWVARSNRYSVTTALHMLRAITRNAGKPWTQTPITAVGSRAISTSVMTPFVVSGLRTWGAEETLYNSSISVSSFNVSSLP